MITPNAEEFAQLSSGERPVPVVCDLLADMETPLSAYWKLSSDAIHSFLLESVTGGEHLARYSFLGFKPKEVIRAKGSQVTVKTPNSSQTRELESGEDALAEVKRRLPKPPVERPGLPKFIGGAVGCVGYDFVRFLEDLPDANPDVLEFDDVAMMICTHVVVFDHAKNLIRIVVLASAGEYEDAVQRIQAIKDRLSQPMPPLPGATGSHVAFEASTTQAQFQGSVEKLKEYIAAGDGIQMVASIRFSSDCTAHPIAIYRCLRTINPSPYMFILRFGDFDVVGASPELLVGLEGRKARVRPIAGTRWRGESPEEDSRLEAELLADEKERAEHIMLVDLGRNDLGRVCDFGTVHPGDIMVVERYSHVMHIVSDVTGTLQPERDSFDLFRATFPAGTVSGAPKVRAMQLIDEVETTRRGLYAGAVGYFSANGDLDTAIALRTILIKDGRAHVQAGAGIVYDSVPESEYHECANKAKAAMRAIELAHSGELFH